MSEKNLNDMPRIKYEKPALVRVQLDVKANTLGVFCWNSSYEDSQASGCVPGAGQCAN